MPDTSKYNKILDALLDLLEHKPLENISVSEIAQTAGIGKGSIYYYFSSKNAILEALVQRNYQKPIETAKTLSNQSNIPPFTRMAMIFQACRDSSYEFLSARKSTSQNNTQENASIHQKYLNYLISELKPELTKIIEQGIQQGEIQFENPYALAEIVLIVLAVKFDNTILPSTYEEIEEIVTALISLLEKGTENPKGSLNFLLNLKALE